MSVASAEVRITKNDPAFTIDHLDLEELPASPELFELPANPTNPINEISIMIDSLIALGKRFGQL